MAAPYSPASPWMSLDDLNQYFLQAQPGEPLASYPSDVQENLNDQNSSSRQPQFMSPPPAPSANGRPPDFTGINKAISDINSANLTGVQNQKDVIERLKSYRDKLPQGPGGIDFMPIMALSDKWGGGPSTLSSTYQRPETAAERSAKQAAVNLQIGEQSGKLTNEELAALKDRLSGEIAKLHYGAVKSDANQKGLDKFTENVVGKYNSDKAVQKTFQVEDAAGNIQDLLNSDNAVAAQSIPTYMARLSGEVGNLSEADKKPFGGSRAFSAAFDQAYQSAKDGRLTDENKAFIAQMTDILKNKAYTTRQRRAAELSEQYGRAHSGVTPQQIYGILSPGSEYKPTAAAQPKASTPKKEEGSSFKAGDVREKDGVKYQRDSNGQWRPM